MRQKVYPQFDQFSENWSPAFEAKELEKFCERHSGYNTPGNLLVLREFCAVYAIPVTRYNLEIALYDAIEGGRVEKSNQEEIEAAREFLRACPEYDRNFACRKNSEVLERWLQIHKLPVTVENLFKAFEACVKNRTIRPTKEGQGIIDLTKALFVRNSVTPEDREKFADRPFELDVARKKRDEQLRRAATADRIARRHSRP